MFSYVKQVGISTALSQEAPAFLASFVIAEVFYKFHSFTLETLAFLATWGVIDAAIQVVRHLFTAPRHPAID